MNRLNPKKSKAKVRSRRPTIERRTKILSGRVTESKATELKQLYPANMTESEIINDLIQEKLTRSNFDKWMAGMRESFDLNDIDLESFR